MNLRFVVTTFFDVSCLQDIMNSYIMRIVFAIGLRKSFQISLTLLNIAEIQARI